MTEELDALMGLEAQFDGVGPVINPITPEMMARRLVWDLVPHQVALSSIEALDLPKVSDDVEQREHQEAHMRMFEMMPLEYLVAQLTRQAALVQLETIKQVNPEVEKIIDHDGLWRLLYTATRAVISELLDTDYIHLSYADVALQEVDPDDVSDWPVIGTEDGDGNV